MNPSIEPTLRSRRLAVVGASATPRAFGNEMYRELKNRGFELFPVNPRHQEIEGDRCWPSLTDLPVPVDAAVFVLPPKAAVSAVAEAKAAGIKYIWFQQMANYSAAIRAAEEAGLRTVSRKCILKYAEPVQGIHKFHRVITQLVGRL